VGLLGLLTIVLDGALAEGWSLLDIVAVSMGVRMGSERDARCYM
jgi:hypothetical protein